MCSQRFFSLFFLFVGQCLCSFGSIEQVTSAFELSKFRKRNAKNDEKKKLNHTMWSSPRPNQIQTSEIVIIIII